MISGWSEATAPEGELERLVYRSNLLGSEPTLTNPGGGNTSVKRKLTDFRGQEVEVLTVKASGTDLVGATEQSFCDLRLDDLRRLRSREAMPDDEMVQYLGRCLLDPAAPRPSIETILHAFLRATHIDHLHADAACAFASAVNGADRLREAFGDEAAWVPYVRPGFALGKLAAGLLEVSPKARFLILQKHGLVTWAGDAATSYRNVLEFITRAEEYISKKRKPAKHVAQPPPAVSTPAELLPSLRANMTGQTRVVLHHDNSPEVLAFVNSEEGRRMAKGGLALPDHVLNTRVWPLILETPEAFETYRHDYERYFQQNQESDDVQDEPLPRVVLVPGAGLIASGSDKRVAALTAENYRQAIRIMQGAETIDNFNPLTEKEAYDVEYWPLERYKLSLRPPARELSGRIALVTGGAGAIGRALCERFAHEGAQVVVSDINGNAAVNLATELCACYGEGTAIGVQTDVTDEASVKAGLAATVQAYGGLDILVCNAGIAFAHPIEETSLHEWSRTMDVLATGYFLTSREGIAVMRSQRRHDGSCLGGSIVFVASKAGLAAARNASAYASAKAATLHLARCLAEEVSADGIRVNSLSPDGVIQGSGLWAGQWGAARAQAHGVPAEQLAAFYRDRNMLKTEVTGADVAEAALFFASDRSRATTGAILSVDGGLHDGYVR